jgi:hypothetical protein
MHPLLLLDLMKAVNSQFFILLALDRPYYIAMRAVFLFLIP